MQVNRTRQSNMELLRIAAMFMIVAIHACMYMPAFCGGGTPNLANGTINGICNIGVALFILISGYYGITCKVDKLVRMECMMITYSLLETVLLVVFLPEEVQGAALLEQVVKSCLPFITRKYWFYSCYVCLTLLSGYIQRFLDVLEQRHLERLLAMLLVLFSIFPTVFYFEIIPDNGKGLVQMILIYMIGRYIRRYRDVRLPRWTMAVFVLLWIVNGVSHEYALHIGGIYHHLCKDNSVTNIAMAIILFYAFKNLRLESGVVNAVASQIFAVFALNNTLTNVVMHGIQRSGFASPGGAAGFGLFLAVVLAILVACIGIGMLRRAVLTRADDWTTRCVAGWYADIVQRFEHVRQVRP